MYEFDILYVNSILATSTSYNIETEVKRLLISLIISAFSSSAYCVSMPALAFSAGQTGDNSLTVAMLKHQLDGQDPLKDINTDYIEALAHEIGFTPKYKLFSDMASLERAIESQKADVAIGVFAGDHSHLFYSEPLYSSSTAVWYRNQNLSHWAPDSLTWGCIKGAVYCNQLADMGFSHVIEVSDFISLSNDLEDGKIDAVLESYTSLLTSVKYPLNTLGQIDLPAWGKPQQVRIAASSHFKALVEEIDNVLSRQGEQSLLRSSNPYHQVDMAALSYKDAGLKPIRYSAWNDAYPLFYRNRDGYYGGYLNDMLKLIEARTAFNFDYVPATEGVSPVEMLKYGEIDVLPMVVKGVNNPSWMYVTDTMMSITYNLIELPGVKKAEDAEAAVLFSDSPTYQYVKDQVFGKNLATYTSVISLIHDLEDGKLSSAYIRHDILEYLLSQRGEDRLVVRKGEDKVIEIAMAIRGDNTQLKGILAGMLASVDANDIMRLQNTYSPFNIVYGVDKSLVVTGSAILTSVLMLLGFIGFLWSKNLKLKVSIQERDALHSKEQLALLQHVINGLPNRIFIHDANYQLLLTNCQGAGPTACSPCSMRINADQPACLVENVDEFNTVLQGQTVTRHDVDVTNCPSGMNTVSYRRTHLRGGENDEKFILTVVNDISAQKEQERHLRQAKNVAQKAVLSRERFLASMSHELRTPIAGMVGLLEMLKIRETNEDTRLILNNVMSSAHHLHLLVNDILDFSKLEAQQLELDSVKCYLLHEIGELLRVHCTAAREKSLDFQVNWTPGRVKTVIVDSLRLRQIINNLLSNAIKFTQSGFVSVDIDVTEREIVMNISDSGEGMSPEFLKTVFDPFVQADSTIARRYGGTGLGLAIVHDLVKVMKGDITIDSEQGKGTSIQVTIPIQVESYFRAPLSETPVHYHGSHPLIEQWLHAWGVKAKRHAPSCGIDVYDDGQTVSNDRHSDMTVILRNNMNGFSLRANNVVELSVSPFFPDLLRNVLKNVSDNEPDEEVVTGQLVGHILVAEDNPINQLVISRQLASFGLSVEVVSNGQEAYDQIKNHPDHFDLLLTDCHMPVMDGYQLASLVRDHFPQFSNKAIIGCTAEDSRVANERALLSGFDTVLYKPYGLSRLYQILAEFLPNRIEDSESNWWQAYEPQDATMLVEVFISSMQDDLGSLLAQRMDPNQVKSLAHRIKGGAGTVGEHDIRLAAERLEQCASTGAQEYETELDQLVQIMTSAIHLAEEWLNEH